MPPATAASGDSREPSSSPDAVDTSNPLTGKLAPAFSVATGKAGACTNGLLAESVPVNHPSRQGRATKESVKTGEGVSQEGGYPDRRHDSCGGGVDTNTADGGTQLRLSQHRRHQERAVEGQEGWPAGGEQRAPSTSETVLAMVVPLVMAANTRRWGAALVYLGFHTVGAMPPRIRNRGITRYTCQTRGTAFSRLGACVLHMGPAEGAGRRIRSSAPSKRRSRSSTCITRASKHSSQHWMCGTHSAGHLCQQVLLRPQSCLHMADSLRRAWQHHE